MDGIVNHETTPNHAYRYNGKELDEVSQTYEYGFRYYDPTIAKFTGVDPIADRFAWVSPFNYAENSPVQFIDLHGLQKWEGQLYDSGRRLAKMTPAERNQYFEETAPLRTGAGILMGGATLGLGGGIYAVTNPATTVHAIRNIGYLLFEATTEQQALGFGAIIFTSKAISKFTSAEKQIIYEASTILSSKEFGNVIKARKEAKISISGYNMHFIPDLPYSGFTDHANRGFTIGADVLMDDTGEEMAKTVLHELWRLNNSFFKGGKRVTTEDYINAGFNGMQDYFTHETKSAQKFADDVIDSIKKE